MTERWIFKQHTEMNKSPFRQKLNDIQVSISWLDIARRYFGKSSSWLYHKLDGIDGNGGEGGFTDEELQQFKGALCDLADRIKLVADML